MENANCHCSGSKIPLHRQQNDKAEKKLHGTKFVLQLKGVIVVIDPR